MNAEKKFIKRIGTSKTFSVVLMMVCLTFMTSLNYFLYPSQQQTSAVIKKSDTSKNNVPPSGPTEEKTSSGGVSILEEFLHDPHPVIDFAVEKQQHLHGIARVGQVLGFDGELLSPPPEL